MIVNVVVPLALNESFSYNSNIALEIGSLVYIPFGRQKVVGLVVEINVSVKDGIILKDVYKKIDIAPIQKELIDFIKWTSEYTMIPLGNLLKMVISPINFLKDKIEKKYSLTGKVEKMTDKQTLIYNYLNNKIDTKDNILNNCNVGVGVLKKLIDNGIIKEIIENKELIQNIQDFNLNQLSQEQIEAYNAIYNNCYYNNDLVFNSFVLEGTTGSGKTEVYFHIVANILKNTDKQILILLPEIALTSQLILRFKNQFNIEPAVWHSEISESKKSDIFKSVINGNIRVVIGTRSSLFLPFKNLGLIVVDEEHDQSYKQSDNGCYNGRDLAVVRAKINNIPIILASATPSLETLINIDKGKYKKVFLPSRYGKAVLPDIKIIDLTKEKLKSNQYISTTLQKEIEKNIKNKKQSMLFMNRRGYSPIVLCGDCGEKISCPNCSVSLTYHKKTNKLVCHHCEYNIIHPNSCPVCGSANIIDFGPGVEKIEKEIKDLFPDARVIIMSSDTTNTNRKLEEIVNSILNNEVDIIIGTQLVAKGHHFPNLTLVGIIDSDASLFSGDIRASEKTYQLLTQVSGRAGREEDKGTVYFQTYTPDNLILQSIKDGNKELLIEFEKENRKLGNFPPYGKMATITISSPKEIDSYRVAKKIASKFPISDDIEILGPVPYFLHKISNMYTFTITIKTTRNINIQRLIRKNVLTEKYNSTTKIKIEIE